METVEGVIDKWIEEVILPILVKETEEVIPKLIEDAPF